MSVQEAFEGLIESEVSLHGPGPGENEHEAGKAAFGPTDRILPKLAQSIWFPR